MARSSRSHPSKEPQRERPVVIDDKLTERLAQEGKNDIALRTLILVDVGNLPPTDVRTALMHVSQVYRNQKHPTFVLPVRNGKPTGDVMFEREIEVVIRKLCEVKDGQIVLRGGYQDIDIVRTIL